jgi:hypothetical protein
MRNPCLVVALLTLGVHPSVARADTPAPPPALTVAISPAGTVKAISDPRTQTTRVELAATGRLLWTLPGWNRWMFVADDGKHVVVGQGGMNLIPRDYDAGMVLFTFWREGKKVREVTLSEVVPGKGTLRMTASHYHWGTIEKIDRQGRLLVRRADGKELRFDLSTGGEVK